MIKYLTQTIRQLITIIVDARDEFFVVSFLSKALVSKKLISSAVTEDWRIHFFPTNEDFDKNFILSTVVIESKVFLSLLYKGQSVYTIKDNISTFKNGPWVVDLRKIAKTFFK